MQIDNPFDHNARRFLLEKELDFKLYAICIPDNSVLEAIYEVFGVKDYEELFPSFKDFMDIAAPNLERTMMWKGKIPEQIHGITVISSVNMPKSPTIIIYLEGMILSPKTKDIIVGRLQRRGAKGDEYAKMSKDVFRSMVFSGKIKGKDLISLCSVEREIRRKCNADNYFMFRELMKREYGFETYQDLNPRETYLLMNVPYLLLVEFGINQKGTYTVQRRIYKDGEEEFFPVERLVSPLIPGQFQRIIMKLNKKQYDEIKFHEFYRVYLLHIDGTSISVLANDSHDTDLKFQVFGDDFFDYLGEKMPKWVVLPGKSKKESLTVFIREFIREFGHLKYPAGDEDIVWIFRLDAPSREYDK